MENESLPTEPAGIAAAAEPNPDSQSPSHKPAASYLHTALVIAIMIAVATMTAATTKGGIHTRGPMAQYVSTIIWLWLLAGLVAYGIHRQGASIREVIGRRWQSLDDVLMDFVIAGGFWIVSVSLLAAMKFAISSGAAATSPSAIKDSLKYIAPLIPHSRTEIFFWIVMSLTAGFCEEFVFRGYLQRQFTVLTKNVAAGIIFSAIIFSVGHLYQGGLQMALIGAYGAMFGMLAHFRKSLRPGMIAHAWQDILSGVVLSLVVQHVAK